MTEVKMVTATNMESALNIPVSAEDYDILSRIAIDSEETLRDIVHEMLMRGVRASEFHMYMNPASKIAQEETDRRIGRERVLRL